ncbi:MAG: putative glycoside hydrolase [bacterium]
MTRQRWTQLASLAALLVLAVPSGTAAKLNLPADKYVRSANHYLEAGIAIPPSDYPRLAKYDLLVLPAEAQNFNRDLFPSLRRLNPNITILAYVPTKSFNFQYWNDELHLNLLGRIQDSWWMRDPSGESISVWPQTKMLNTVSPWSKELPKYVQEEIWSTGLWDGILYDEFSVTVSWVNGGNIDIHGDGVRDDPHLADVAWERATINMLRDTRERLGPSAVIITNGDSASSVQPFLNGRMFESFPTPWEGAGRWEDSFGNYLRLQDEVGYQPVFVINGNTGNTGTVDYRQVRFTLTSALMGDGFFCYDFGEEDHGQMWWYDEQDISLGNPLGPPVNHSSGSRSTALPGVWRREFRNGTVLLNSTDKTQTVEFDADRERIRGTQDPAVNNGQITKSVTLAPHDGIVLLKPVETVSGSSFMNGAFARLYDLSGRQLRNGFFAYVPPHTGSDRVLLADLDGDGRDEKLVADRTKVYVYAPDGKLKLSFEPYGPKHVQGISLAVGDLNGDGRREIVTGPGPGTEPLIRFFDGDGQSIWSGFLAYSRSFRGGVNVATGDVYGTGREMVVTGAGPGGGPHVRVFDRYGRVWAQFYAYNTRFLGGIDIAAGDLNGDGLDEIVTGAGPGGGPHVRVFTAWAKPIGGFFVGDPKARGGIGVSVSDTDGDGTDEIVALSTDIFRLKSGNQ